MKNHEEKTEKRFGRLDEEDHDFEESDSSIEIFQCGHLNENTHKFQAHLEIKNNNLPSKKWIDNKGKTYRNC